MTRKKITSFSNPLVKQTAEMASAGQRGSRGFFLAEGPHLVRAASDAGAVLKEVFYTEEFGCTEEGMALLELLAAARRQPASLIEVPAAVFAKMAGTETPQGILAAAAVSELTLGGIRPSGHALLAVCDGIQDPGNLGTIIRVADAAGADAVIVLPDSCDPYALKTVRASAGSIFNLPVISCPREVFVHYLSEKGIRLYTADARAAATIYETDFLGPCALAFGNEARGISVLLRASADGAVKIPILGKAESLNAAVAASICLYEAVRQRRSTV